MIQSKQALLYTSCILWGLVACDSSTIDDAAPLEEPTMEPEVEPEEAVIEHRCESVGTFDFNMKGEGLADFEGLTVWASAVEPIDGPQEATVTVLLETSVQDGAFDTLCPNSLQEQYYYPSYVVVFDSDDSGDCSAGDTYYIGQFYGWNEDVTAVVDPTQPLEIVGDTRTWGDREFCEYYVPERMLD